MLTKAVSNFLPTYTCNSYKYWNKYEEIPKIDDDDFVWFAGQTEY